VRLARWIAIGICSAVLTVSTETDGDMKKKDIKFAEVDGHELFLDLYLPDDSEGVPLIVWVHGGAWRRGSRERVPIEGLVADGFAVASVDYRLSPVARFPAQIHDIKAAIRFLRATKTHYGYSTDRIGIAGSSAGGHLVALVGTTNGHSELEGTVGDHVGQSSDVQAIVSYFGASNFMTILKQSTPHGLKVRVPALELFIGGQPEDIPEVAQLASPVFHVDADDPPLFLLHGDQDPQMPINQSHELHAKFKEMGLTVSFEVVHGAAHGGKLFYDDRRNEQVRTFLNKHIR
jgi:acetyl esterase/lipase